jgi:ceramide glucosyltransferase
MVLPDLGSLPHLAMTILVMLGLLQGAVGLWLLRRLALRRRQPVGAQPGVSVLKPLCGDEPLLESALASVCAQNYPNFQVVFGVHDAHDPALAVVERVRARFPDCDIEVVSDATQHGSNRKVGNLLNMLAAARHDTLVIADSDVHVAPDWLESLVTTLQRPGVGLATSLYTGVAADHGLAAQLGAMQISHSFLPGAVLARAMGRQDCLGANMALDRQLLARIGGLEALRDELADDAVLGQLVLEAGLKVALAPTVPATTVPETRLRDLWRHELRWARTIRALEPAGQAASVLQYPLAWAMLGMAFSGFAEWNVGVFLLAWTLRAAIALSGETALGRLGGVVTPAAFWLLPFRDLLSVSVTVASFAGNRVIWRGQVMSAHILHGQPMGTTLRPSSGRLVPEEG